MSLNFNSMKFPLLFVVTFVFNVVFGEWNDAYFGERNALGLPVNEKWAFENANDWSSPPSIQHTDLQMPGVQTKNVSYYISAIN